MKPIYSGKGTRERGAGAAFCILIHLASGTVRILSEYKSPAPAEFLMLIEVSSEGAMTQAGPHSLPLPQHHSLCCA